ncbi:M42 family metallopeptidase [Cytobacillus sp. Hm23]
MTKQLDETLMMLKDLTDAKGISGNEREVREVMEKYISPFADEVKIDGLGSLVARKTGMEKGPRIMLAAHLDEVGFIVTQIDKNGFIRFQTIGGWWSQVMLAQRVTIVTKLGDITGVIGSKPPHLLSVQARKKPADIKNMYIDVGASSKEEAVGWGISPGDQIVPHTEFTVMQNEKMLLAKAWDNRVGCAVAIEVMKRLDIENHPNVFYGVGTAQEEIGLRGAKTSAHMIQPDIAISVDVGIAGDTPGVNESEAVGKMGEGPQVILYDSSMIAHKGLRDFVTNIAEAYNIPYQFDLITGGTTDSGAIHLTGKGVPTLTITIPTRYIHTNAALLHRDDYENTIKLVVEVIKQLDESNVQKITFN